MRKPFYKKSHDAWYCHSERGVVRLGKTEAEAFGKWNELRQGKPLGLSLAKLAGRHLEWVGRNRAKETLANYKRHLDRWLKHDGALCVSDIKPHHLDTLCKQEFAHCSETTHWQVYKVAIAMMNWAVEQGHIESHSLGKIKDKPQCGVREHWIKQDDFDKIIATARDTELRDLLTVLSESGARPFEIMQVEARHLDVDGRCLRFSRLRGDKVKAKRKKKEAARIIQLTDGALAILTKLAQQYPEGKLFRNTYGSRWTAGLL